MKIIGLYDNPKHNISNDHPIIKQSQAIIEESIGIIDDDKIIKAKKIDIFTINMKKNTNFQYLTAKAFLQSPLLKHVYKEYPKHTIDLFSEYFILSSLILLPSNTKKITTKINAIKEIKSRNNSSKYTIDFTIINNDEHTNYKFYLDNNLLIYDILMENINLCNVYSVIMHDMYTENKKMKKLELKKKIKLFLKNLKNKNQGLKCQATKQ